MSSQPLRPVRETARGCFRAVMLKPQAETKAGLAASRLFPVFPVCAGGRSGCPGIVPVRSLPLPTASALCAAHSCLSPSACARPGPRVLLL